MTKRLWLLLDILVIVACFAAMSCHSAETNIFTCTAYCPCAKCCGRANQPTASGKMPIEGMTVAGPRRYPLGTKVWIEGVGERVIQDRLARRYDDRFDIFFTNHADAKRFGIKKLKVVIYEKR